MTGRIPQFGVHDPFQRYSLRPSAYVVVMEEDRLAVVDTPKGLMLPGGGQDQGESLERAALRELGEECGLLAEITGQICLADQYIHSPQKGRFVLKRSSFFAAKATGLAKTHREADHALLWMSLDEAEGKLEHGSHRWAVQQFDKQGATGNQGTGASDDSAK